jgi:hypothetical protein
MKYGYAVLLFFLLVAGPCFAQLKSMVYDFDGLDIGQIDLPEGDYRKYDMQAAVSANPLGQSEMLGDRVLKLVMNWNLGKANFGKGISRFIELNAAQDRFNFYIYVPAGNTSDTRLDVIITEDDNKNNIWEDGSDDRWKRSVIVSRSASWQLISLPLSSFVDNNAGGNGIFDATFTAQGGKIFNIEFDFTRNAPSDLSSTVYLDMICFSQGALPTGTSILNYPAINSPGHCILGAFASNTSPQTTPAIVEGLFPADPQKKIKYVNWFIDFSEDGTTVANKLPGPEVTQLLQNGYTPVITWEAMFSHLSRLDPAQPRLNDLLSTRFDSYIDAFGDKLKSYNDTIIIRFMHEFEGDWYPWSLSENGGDPNLYISVFRKFVNRIRARGATKVKWMWCINSTTYHPVLAYNWVVGAYPGNAYVDIVACEAYNLSIPGIPYWRSFRAGIAEPYYYLRNYFPSKPMFICENGCRERYSSEDPTSQTKAQWISVMDKELQTNFKEIKALIFFDISKSQDYRLNSSAAALNSVQTNIWNDPYYFAAPPVSSSDELISKGSAWKYLDNGSNLGTAWRQPVYSETGWKTGNAILGYGNGNETTVVGYGGSPTSKYITTYFRKSFSVTNATSFTGLNLSLLRDDGAVVYLNGAEIWRSNMPSGTIYFNTLAPNYIDGAAESAYVNYSLSSARLVNGTNVIAVEIHQNSPTSSDIVFDLQLKATAGEREEEPSGEIEVTTFTDSSKADLLIYPNPTSGTFTLEFCLEKISEHSVTIEILNSLGQMIYVKTPEIRDDCIREVIELDNRLPTGIYILNVRTGKVLESKRLLLSN